MKLKTDSTNDIVIYDSMHSRMDEVKLVEDSL